MTVKILCKREYGEELAETVFVRRVTTVRIMICDSFFENMSEMIKMSR